MLDAELDLTAASRALLTPAPGGLAALLVSGDRRRLAWWTGAWDALQKVVELELDAPVARAAVLSGTGAAAWAVWVDERARLRVSRVEQGRFQPPQTLAEGVDRRFVPALASVDSRLLVAFTRSVDEVMHAFVASVGGPAQAPQDVTPQGHGGAAPTFVRGVAPPLLVMVDARAGVSPLLEVPFDAQGRPGAAIVRTPVSQPYAPPQLAAVALPSGQIEVAFTAIGRAAATAIGRVPLREPLQAVALVPSKGYGVLDFTALRGERAALFAVETSRQASNDPARGLQVKLVDAQGEGGSVEIGGEAASASAPSLSVGEGPGIYVLAYTRGDSVWLARLVCDG